MDPGSLESQRKIFEQATLGVVLANLASDRTGRPWITLIALPGVHSTGSSSQGDPLGGGYAGARGRLQGARSTDQLLHGQEGRVYGDQAYKSQGDVIRAKAPKAKDFTNGQCKWKHYTDEAIKAKNRTKSRIRARVEHSIGVIKWVFGFRKVRYRGLAKNGIGCSRRRPWPTSFWSDTQIEMNKHFLPQDDRKIFGCADVP
jgi:hypothetical protein